MSIDEKKFTNELKEFVNSLNKEGLHGALKYLNNRTPHRYTGIYRYGDKTLINIVKYDKYKDQVVTDEKVPLEVTYCSLVKELGQLDILDANTDERVKGKIDTPVVSYGGVLMEDEQGHPFGTLCHFDFKRCEDRTSDLPLLKSASTILFEYLKLQNKLS
jgi:hypothetical protein